MVVTIICLCLIALAISPGAEADTWNKKTRVTFSAPVEIPGGIVLPAGTYIFKLMDSSFNRNIVQVFNEDQTHLYATILAIPNYRLRSTDKTVMTFGEREVGSPEAIRAWFYPGANWGQEFVYPRIRAMELAKVANIPVLAMPAEMVTAITTPAKTVSDEPVVALKQAPLTAVQPTGNEVEIAQVVTPPPVQAEDTNTRETVDQLPQTASQLPLLGLIGLLSLGAGFGIMVFSKRSA